jgi:transposase-like protein
MVGGFMRYQEFPLTEFFTVISTEQEAINLVWNYKSADGYNCPRCYRKKFYQHKNRPEIRECKHCGHQHRLRVGTIFQNSKVPMLTWVRAIYLMMMGKRGISALELKRQLKLGSYKTALYMLNRIRAALLKRDEQYKLEGMIELDGAFLGKKSHNNQQSVLVAIESKQWINEQGEELPKAGFAKVYFSKEDNESANQFVSKDIRPTSTIHTDGAKAYLSGLEGVEVKSLPTYGDDKILEHWLPWVHKFISNAKSWIVGTHHGVNAKYFKLYLAEYTYRFNRRHDVKRFFSRALYSCVLQFETPRNPDFLLAA